MKKILTDSIKKFNNEPIIFNLKLSNDQEKLKKLLRIKRNCINISDKYESQIKELFFVKNPIFRFDQARAKAEWGKYLNKINTKNILWKYGRWVYFEWNNCLVHILDKDDFFNLRAARNKNLIREDEQKKFKQAKVGIAGLSVGSSIALALALESGCCQMNLADFDELELTNLNRIRGSVCNLGENKAILAARQIYELNPYAKINIYNKGLNIQNLNKFISTANIIVDEVDDLKIKIEMRKSAKKFKIPLVSATDNDSHSIIDIERFDLEPNRPIFHGKVNERVKIEKMDFNSKIKLTNKIVGTEYITKRMMASLSEIGKSIYSWPQLGGAAMIGGGVLTYIIRQIVLGNKKIKSGKYEFNPESVFS